MGKGTVVKVSEVMPFSHPDFKGQFISKMLIDPSNSGSEKMQINQFTLKAGCGIAGWVHKAPYDEVYYVLSGEAILHMDGVDYDIGKDTVVFIPGGTFHALTNKSATEDFVILTIWPMPPEPGVNEVYDLRRETWGKTFRKVGE
ncbi:MAG: cupin domain-containing protein [Candidatus Latescibacteria bacterium]|nr:cupin domain-containing protein [Candidatus Latescibacterota bacterium]